MTSPQTPNLREALERIAEVLDQSGGDQYAIEARSIARLALATPEPDPVSELRDALERLVAWDDAKPSGGDPFEAWAAIDAEAEAAFSQARAALANPIPDLDATLDYELDTLAIHVGSFMEPMGTEEPSYLRGKQAGLQLAVGLIRERATRLSQPTPGAD